MNILERIIDKRICANTIRKQSAKRIEYLIELSISSKRDSNLINLIVDYSKYDLYTISLFTENQLYYNLYECFKHSLNSKVLLTICNNIVKANIADNDNISIDNFRYAKTMNILEAYHKWLSNKLSKDSIIEDEEIREQLIKIAVVYN